MNSLKDITEIEDKPIIVANQGGYVTFINKKFTEDFGWEFEDVIGKPLTIILPKSFNDAHNLAFSRFQATEISTILDHPLELMTVSKNGREILTEHFISAEKKEGIWYFAAILKPLA
ncbi:PAS domain-containing protein [Synechocystis salina LEGE 06155]|nr:PAS domain-containing protein [Synechocystis salina LEGE 06155]